MKKNLPYLFVVLAFIGGWAGDSIRSYFANTWKAVSAHVDHAFINETKLREMPGKYYKMTEIELRDLDDNGVVSILAGKSIPVVIDKHDNITFNPLKTIVRLSPELSFLHVDPENNCTFQWRLETQDETVDLDKASLGRFKLAGSDFITDCFADLRQARVPAGLFPFKNAVYHKTEDGVDITSEDKSMAQIIHYTSVDRIKKQALR